MEKILVMVLIEVFGRFLSQKFLKILVMRTTILFLEKLKQRKFFKDELTETKVDDLIQLFIEELK